MRFSGQRSVTSDWMLRAFAQHDNYMERQSNPNSASSAHKEAGKPIAR